ncbi:gp53 minor capsid family protein [Segnochrobactrum spirostomi]|uniref:DUF2190 domain-containing protein n=1 Tax=Segnochrobactrum spirostomi TaxID=2608987 RepID=A0A6A7Y6F6_9HYPH|nr:capsid cement protein [Segnochrobactrum spirostomi]MQT13648.1 DUF2190 domain-containing protein [Segnochrobactrum spirostomi]
MNIIKNYTAGARVEHRRFVRLSADRTVVPATAATDEIIGVTDAPNGVDAGGPVDVVLFGIASVEAGGAVTRGAWLTAAADGKAVAAAPAAGANAIAAARAVFEAASSGDFSDVFVHPTRIQG